MVSQTQHMLRRSKVGHGSWMILSSLVGGLGLWCYILGGFEIVPGYIIKFNLPGSEAGWVRYHTGPVANGFMVIVTALGMPHLDLPDSTAKWLGWIVMMDGWSNLGFYFFGNISPNRGLALGASRLGPPIHSVFWLLVLLISLVFWQRELLRNWVSCTIWPTRQEIRKR